MKYKISALIIIGCLIACKNVSTEKNFDQLEKMHWLVGEWKNSTSEMDFTEIWKKETDSSYRAESFIVATKDTVFFEHVLLEETNDSLFYRAYNRKEKLSQAISFYATKIDSNLTVFENPKHDYPNKIIYNKINNDSIVATIEGVKNGQPLSEKFPMKRKN